MKIQKPNKKILTSVRIDEKLLKQLNKIARKNDVTLSAAINAVLNVGLNGYEPTVK